MSCFTKHSVQTLSYRVMTILVDQVSEILMSAYFPYIVQYLKSLKTPFCAQFVLELNFSNLPSPHLTTQSWTFVLNKLLSECVHVIHLLDDHCGFLNKNSSPSQRLRTRAGIKFRLCVPHVVEKVTKCFMSYRKAYSSKYKNSGMCFQTTEAATFDPSVSNLDLGQQSALYVCLLLYLQLNRDPVCLMQKHCLPSCCHTRSLSAGNEKWNRS